jgi:hypothetical protein
MCGPSEQGKIGAGQSAHGNELGERAELKTAERKHRFARPWQRRLNRNVGGRVRRWWRTGN